MPNTGRLAQQKKGAAESQAMASLFSLILQILLTSGLYYERNFSLFAFLIFSVPMQQCNARLPYSTN
jgi:hypothetical protein